jgi:hypothetical protein
MDGFLGVTERSPRGRESSDNLLLAACCILEVLGVQRRCDRFLESSAALELWREANE